MGPVSQALEWMGVLPPWALLLILSAGALLENLLPPVPADTFVVVGGLLAARGEVGALSVLLGIWIANGEFSCAEIGCADSYCRWPKRTSLEHLASTVGLPLGDPMTTPYPIPSQHTLPHLDRTPLTRLCSLFVLLPVCGFESQ